MWVQEAGERTCNLDERRGEKENKANGIDGRKEEVTLLGM